MSHDVAGFYAALGVELPDRGGAERPVRCFANPDGHQHDDRNPSCSVNADSGAWCCHACGHSGGAYDAAVALGKTPPDAMGLLEHFGLVERDSPPAPSPQPVSVTESQVKGWHTDLMSNAAAIQRLRDLRGPVAEEALVRLEVGLDGDRLVFPYRDHGGELTGAVRYQPNPDRRNGRPKTEAKKGTRRQLVPPPETLDVAADRCLYLVEGEPDALCGQSVGLPTVGVPGSGGWKADWVARFAGRRVCLLPDADSAGRESAKRIEADLQGVASTVQVVDLHPERDDGADLTDFLREATADGNGSVEHVLLLFDRMTAAAPVQEDPPPNGGELLGEVVDFIRRYVAMSAAQADVVALWIVHTHALDAADATPYLAVTSAEKRSGKSRLLEAMALLVARPLSTMNVSDAALFRSLTEPPPTVLFDEVDAVYGAKARDREDQRGMINAGYRRGASVLRCVGDGAKQRVEPFPVFAAKALAGIGELPDTVADRAIPIRLERRGPQERVARFRLREVEPVAETLRAAVIAFADKSLDALRAARPHLPDELDDRAQDVAEPLLAIADLAGGDWPRRARRALIELRNGATVEDESIGVRLLADVRDQFGEQDRISSSDLLDALTAIEEAPWGDWYGKPLSSRTLARLLKPYGIHSRSVRRDDGTTPKGFFREQFESAFSRYLPPNTPSIRHTATTRTTSGIEANPYPPQNPLVADTKSGANPYHERDVADVADTDRGKEGEA